MHVSPVVRVMRLWCQIIKLQSILFGLPFAGEYRIDEGNKNYPVASAFIHTDDNGSSHVPLAPCGFAFIQVKHIGENFIRILMVSDVHDCNRIW